MSRSVAALPYRLKAKHIPDASDFAFCSRCKFVLESPCISNKCPEAHVVCRKCLYARAGFPRPETTRYHCGVCDRDFTTGDTSSWQTGAKIMSLNGEWQAKLTAELERRITYCPRTVRRLSSYCDTCRWVYIPNKCVCDEDPVEYKSFTCSWSGKYSEVERHECGYDLALESIICPNEGCTTKKYRANMIKHRLSCPKEVECPRDGCLVKGPRDALGNTHDAECQFIRCELTERTDCNFVGPAAELGLHGLQCTVKYKFAVVAELAELAALKAAQAELVEELEDAEEEGAVLERKSTSTPVEPDANSGAPSPENCKSSKRSSLDGGSESDSDSSESDSPSAQRRVKARLE